MKASATTNTIMSRNFSHPARYLFTAALLTLVAGCSINRTVTGPTQTDTKTIEANGASSARVEVNLGAGELKLSGGASELAQAEFIYNISGWKPTVNYSVSESRGTLIISQPNSTAVLPQNIRYEWNVKLNNDIPIDLKINMGAGTGDLNLSGMKLSSADISGGVGKLQLDLSGAWAKPAHINIEGGVGKVSLRLPKEVSVRVKANAGLGRVTANGLSKDGDTYVNPAYGKASVNLDITISAGVGEITLDVE